MRAIAPRTGAPEQTVAEEQLEYKPITVCLYQQPDESIVVLTRWTFSPEERKRVAEGEDIYVALLTDGDGMNPINVQVGPEGWEATDVPQ